MKVLIVEDEKNLAKAIDCILKEKKFYTDVVYDGKTAIEYAMILNYDIIILDVMLPKKNGYEVSFELRKNNIHTPILMLSARSTTEDKVNGLNYGADDYMTKPFEPIELIARINALTRRKGEVVLNELKFLNLILNIDTSELICDSEKIKLNFKEKEIMKIFFKSPEIIISKDKLITDVWGIDSEAVDNNVEAYISFLRKKLKYIGSSVTIHNFQKIGYKME